MSDGAAGPGAPDDGVVEVVVVELDRPSGGAGAARATLSAEERAMAERLRVGAGRWVSARAALRAALAHRLGIAPGEVRLVTGAGGRPELDPGHARDLRFSLSRSDALGLIALCEGAAVGADLERLRDDVDIEAVAAEMLPAAEQHALRALSGAERTRAFFRAWTRHEAWAKATGRGIVLPSTEPPPGDFMVRDLDDIAGYAAAVASSGRSWSLRRVAQ